VKSIKSNIKCFLRIWTVLAVATFPLQLRKRVAMWLFRQEKLPGTSWVALELLSDFRRDAYSEYHKFLWGNHLFYADTFNADERFGSEKQREASRKFFELLPEQLRSLSISPDQVSSVLEVACSVGHQLRVMETHIFPNAKELLGFDIDETAIAEGRKALASQGSAVELKVGDIENLSDIIDNRKFDVVICTGALMYLDEKAAAACVGTLLRHTNYILGISGLANPGVPNNQLEHSIIRDWDHSLIHNLEKMVLAGGGRVLGVGWEVEEIVDDRTNYFVFSPSAE
jgi:SAM-dependent methyltransferase